MPASYGLTMQSGKGEIFCVRIKAMKQRTESAPAPEDSDQRGKRIKKNTGPILMVVELQAACEGILTASK